MCDKHATTNNKVKKTCHIRSKDVSHLKKQLPKFRIEDNILIGKELPVNRDPVNVSEILLSILQRNPECIGQVDAFTDKKYTYADMMKRSIKCALWLKKQGVKPGDIVSLCTDNNLDAIVIMLGTMYIGAISNTWDHELSPNTAKYFLSLMSPAVIFTISLSAASLTQAATQLNIDVEIVTIDKLNGYKCFEDILNSHDFREIVEFRCTISNPDDIALIVLSSGTTGMPKATEISHSSLYNSMLSEVITDMKNHICAWTPTLRWHYGVMLAFNCLTACATRIIIPDCDTDKDTIQICQFIEKYRITWFATDPCMLIEMAKSDILTDKYRLPTLKKIMSSGAHLYKRYQEILAKKFPHIVTVNCYGSTDFGGTNCCQNEYSKPGSVGFITHCSRLKVVDVDTGKILGANQVGEIHFKGPRTMRGYYKNLKATERAFDSDGWLRTGDLGYYDDDGEVFLVDRISEFILYRSINVSPAEIEAVLAIHPAVARAAVVGIHHEVDEQHPMGVVSLIPGKTVTEQELINLVETNLPDHCRLRAGVKFVDEVPYTKTGKIARTKLREMFANYNAPNNIQ